MAAKSKTGQWPVDSAINPTGAAGEKLKRQPPWKTSPAQPAAPSPAAVSKAQAHSQTKASPHKAAPTKKSASTVQAPQLPGLDDMAMSVAQAKLKLEEAETLQAARIVALAQEEEDASASVTTAAKQEETSQLHLQLTWEQNYLNSITDTGPAADKRRADHQANIKWYQHRITNLKAPADKVKSLTRGVSSAEKMLTKAGEARDAALAARDAAEAEYQLSLDAVVQASSDFAIVKG